MIYHLSCPYCFHLWWSKNGFPKKCPKCRKQLQQEFKAGDDQEGLPFRGERMSGTVYRIEPDGSETEIAFIDSPQEFGIVIDEDRQKIDYEAGYYYSGTGDLQNSVK